MAQDGTTAGGASYTLDNVTFPVGRNKLQSIFDAIRSTNIGNTAPDLVAGQFWIDNNTPSTTVWTLYFFDGTDSISFATIDTINNTVNFIDSTFTQLSSNLDLNSYTINGTGNIDITGNITASGNLAGTLTTASQPNITSVGTLTGLTTTGDINLGDNDKAVFGAGSDLQIYHDGSSNHSVINEIGTGNLKLQGTNVVIEASNGTATQAEFFAGDANRFYYNNSLKLATTNTGIDVTGTVTSDGLTVDGNTVLNNSGSIGYAGNLVLTLNDTANDYPMLRFTGTSGGLFAVRSEGSNSLQFYEDTGTALKKRMFIQEGGDISFYEDTGVTPKLFWDASAESLGIGTTSPSSLSTLHTVDTAANAQIIFETTHPSGVPNLQLKGAASATLRYLDETGAIQSRIDFTDGGSFNFLDGSGNSHLKIDSSGNVGIGTSSPSAPLDVNGQIITTIDGTATNVSIALNDGNTGFFRPSDNTMGFATAGIERMRIDSSGNLKFNSGYGSVATAYGVRAWVNFNGQGTVSIRGSGNVSSITDSGTGLYYVNFTNNMPDTNFSTQATTKYVAGSGVGTVAFLDNTNSTSRTHQIVTAKMNNNFSTTDADTVNVMVMR